MLRSRTRHWTTPRFAWFTLCGSFTAKLVAIAYFHQLIFHPQFAPDPAIPAGFSVFGIRDIDGLVFVSFASSAGNSGGFIDIYSEAGVLLSSSIIHGAPLNQPWGFGAAPNNFGPLSNTLLISNNTNSGTINAFNLLTRQFVGTVKDTSGDVIHIDQLWAIDFGGGGSTPSGSTNTLFFTAGPDNNLVGEFGKIVFK